jgi:hypothetical protein
MEQAGEVDYLITWRDNEFVGRVSLTPCRRAGANRRCFALLAMRRCRTREGAPACSVPLRCVRAVEGAGRLFSTPSRPALRVAASGGRPRAGNDTPATGAGQSSRRVVCQLRVDLPIARQHALVGMWSSADRR